VKRIEQVLGMTTWMPAVIIGLISGVAVRLWYRQWRARRIASRRIVEKPNSHYASDSVRAQEDRERWGEIDFGALHPLNREEVSRLLTMVDREGVKALSPRDRLFLDNMTLPRLG
jgi:hypothetical protein